MILVAWNVRGLMILLKLEVTDFIMKHNTVCCALFEARVRRTKVENIRKNVS